MLRVTPRSLVAWTADTYVAAKSPAHPLPDLHHECWDILQCVHHSILTDLLVIEPPTPEARASVAHRARHKPVEQISLLDARKKEGVWPVVAPVTVLGTVPQLLPELPECEFVPQQQAKACSSTVVTDRETVQCELPFVEVPSPTSDANDSAEDMPDVVPVIMGTIKKKKHGMNWTQTLNPQCQPRSSQQRLRRNRQQQPRHPQTR